MEISHSLPPFLFHRGTKNCTVLAKALPSRILASQKITSWTVWLNTTDCFLGTIKSTPKKISIIYIAFFRLPFFPFFHATPSKPTVWFSSFQAADQPFSATKWKSLSPYFCSPNHPKFPNNLGAWKMYLLLIRKKAAVQLSTGQRQQALHTLQHAALPTPYLAPGGPSFRTGWHGCLFSQIAFQMCSKSPKFPLPSVFRI